MEKAKRSYVFQKPSEELVHCRVSFNHMMNCVSRELGDPWTALDAGQIGGRSYYFVVV